MSSGAFGSSIAVTNDETTLPPCIGARIRPNLLTGIPQFDVNSSCLQSLLPLILDIDGWPTGLPRPRGIIFDDIVRVLGQDSISYINQGFNALNGKLGGFSTSVLDNCDPTGASRIFSCKQGEVANQNFYVTPGNNKVLQPMSAGCTIYQQFCPLFSNISDLYYRFWTYYPDGYRPSAANVKTNKIEMYLWPGIHNNECGNNISVLKKRSCNMDNNGATCFRISSQELGDIINQSLPGVPVVPLNIGIKWNIQGYNRVSSWQTYIVINESYAYGSELAECFRV